jgi:two-component system sensor histidine kinase YesM
LQPVVENAIFHGIMDRPEKTGKIEILGKLEENLIILKVVDDGIGMEKEVLDNIFNSTGVKVGSSYGLKNVNERLKLFYGEEYGLHFESEYGLGTTVEIKIPALKNAP